MIKRNEKDDLNAPRSEEQIARRGFPNTAFVIPHSVTHESPQSPKLFQRSIMQPILFLAGLQRPASAFPRLPSTPPSAGVRIAGPKAGAASRFKVKKGELLRTRPFVVETSSDYAAASALSSASSVNAALSRSAIPALSRI
jgi:hypothetical protein